MRKLLAFAFAVFGLAGSAVADCGNFNYENNCPGQQVDQPESWSNRRFQTPPRDSSGWRNTYQDYDKIVGYSSVFYSNDHLSATVSVNVWLADNSSSVQYFFNGGSASSTNKFSIDHSFSDELQITVVAVNSKGEKGVLELDPVHFLWNNAPINAPSQLQNGQKGAIVEMFGWPYDDIALECEMLGKAGYLGVKVFPPQESVMSYEWLQNGELNPWYFIYQPVSYKLNSRSGDRTQLRKMIDTCRSHGVRVYADAVINHMTGGGNDIQNHRNGQGSSCATWGGKSSTGGSPYFTQDFNYVNNSNTNDHPGLEYPAVPYGPLDFHCERSLNSWTDPFILNAGWLVGLSDLNTEKPYVQQRIADYLTDLISMGFSGFRVDAAKHIKPDDLAAIFGRFKKNLGGSLPNDFISYLEVIIGGEKDLFECQDNNYNYITYFPSQLMANGLTSADVDKILIWSSDYPKEFPICGSWIVPPTRFAIENDCADDQNPGSSSRDMGDKGSVLIREKDVNKHRGFEVQLFTRTDGNWNIRLVLSSYTYMDSGAAGFPDGFSDCKLYNGTQPATGCKTMAKAAAHDPNACGYSVTSSSGQWLQGVYTRVHRDRSIIMAMRSWMGLPTNVPNSVLGLPDNCS